jgi:hypothetical protein
MTKVLGSWAGTVEDAARAAAVAKGTLSAVCISSSGIFVGFLATREGGEGEVVQMAAQNIDVDVRLDKGMRLGLMLCSGD